MNPLDPLLRRGITAQTMAHFGIVDGHDGYWHYPVRQGGAVIGIRAKRMSPGVPKYRWVMSDEGASTGLYAASEVVVDAMTLLCEGEPDTWLMHSAGIPACCFLCGSGTVPERGVAQLAACRPGRVLVVYDNDAPGHSGAIKAVQALRGAGLLASAIQLPEAVGEHGDITDLWRLCGRDRDIFLQTLLSCPHLSLPALPPPKTRQPLRLTLARKREEFNEHNDLVSLVERYADLKRSGGALVGKCPLPRHKDDTPSFHVYEEGGRSHFHCYGCSESGDAWWFARTMGLLEEAS